MKTKLLNLCFEISFITMNQQHKQRSKEFVKEDVMSFQQSSLHRAAGPANHGAVTPSLGIIDEARKRDSVRRMQERERRVLKMISEMITPDGVLNLQAKNIQQSLGDGSFGGSGQNPESDGLFVQQQMDRMIDLDNIFGARYPPERGPAAAVPQGSFERILKLNLSSNRIQAITDEFCLRLPNIEVLDLRANRIAEISTSIGFLVHLRVLKLDKNDLTNLPEEVFDIKGMQELTFQQNRVSFLSPKIGQLVELKKLNMASNIISKIPETIGSCQELETLCIQNNRFASFPCSFLQLTNLRELSLEWFIYAKPPKPQYISRKSRDGTQIFESLMVLCNLLQKYKMNECALITFLENYSDDNFDKNQRDNRQRTPLHKAAVMGDTGVIDGLLMDKANTDLLDKDSCTPLCLAIRQENYEAAQSLIEGGADVNLGGGIFGSPVHLAVVRLKISIIQALIDKKADLNKQDSDGNTPLHLVMNIFSKNPERCCHILELLALNGARVNQKNHDHWAPLHTAVRKGQEKGVHAVIRLNTKLAERNLEQFDLNITGGIQQWSSLHLAAHASQLQIIVDLTRAGADIFQRNYTNQLPRHCAKGNYIMTKNIKHIEQRCLNERFKSFKVEEGRLAGLTAREQQLFLVQSATKNGQPEHQPPKAVNGSAQGSSLQEQDRAGHQLKDSKMQPIQKKNTDKGAGVQATNDKHQALNDYHLDKGYQSFTRHLRNAKTENMRPVTHLQSKAPILQKSMTLGELGELVGEDACGPQDNPGPRGVDEDVVRGGSSLSQASEDAVEAEMADTLRENASDGLQSLDAEYDVVDEDEARLSRRIQANWIGDKSALRGKGHHSSESNLAWGNELLHRPSHLLGASGQGDALLGGHLQAQDLSVASSRRDRAGDSFRRLTGSNLDPMFNNFVSSNFISQRSESKPAINMHHLRDTILKQADAAGAASGAALTTGASQTRLLLEQLDAISKMKANSHLNVFMHIMRQLFISGDFLRIQESVVQIELLAVVGNCQHFGLIDCMVKLLQEPTSTDVEDALQEAINLLEHSRIVARRNPRAIRPAAGAMSEDAGGMRVAGAFGGRGIGAFPNRQHYGGKMLLSAAVQARHHSPSQHQMEGGQRHLGLASAGSNSLHDESSLLPHNGNRTYRSKIEQGNAVGASQTQSTVHSLAVASHRLGASKRPKAANKRKGPQSFAGLVPPMQILNAQDKAESTGSSKVIKRLPSNGNMPPFGSQFSSQNQSQQKVVLGQDSERVDLDDTVRESKSFVEGDGLSAALGAPCEGQEGHDGRAQDGGGPAMAKNLPKQVEFASSGGQSQQRNSGPGGGGGRRLHQKDQAHGRRAGRASIHDVFKEMAEHREEQAENFGALPAHSQSANDQFLSAGGLSRISAGPLETAQRALAPGRPRVGSSFVQIDDKLPSSPQSINIFETKMAHNIQLGQRLHRQQAGVEEGHRIRPDLERPGGAEAIMAARRGPESTGLQPEALSQQRRKESLILQRQNLINTQRGLNPISPQSLNLAQIHQMQGPASHREYRDSEVEPEADQGAEQADSRRRIREGVTRQQNGSSSAAWKERMPGRGAKATSKMKRTDALAGQPKLKTTKNNSGTTTGQATESFGSSGAQGAFQRAAKKESKHSKDMRSPVLQEAGAGQHAPPKSHRTATDARQSTQYQFK